MGEELESLSQVFPSDWKQKTRMKRPPEHCGHILVINYYLETEMHGGTGDTVNREASSPKRVSPSSSLRERGAAWLVGCGQKLLQR